MEGGVCRLGFAGWGLGFPLWGFGIGVWGFGTGRGLGFGTGSMGFGVRVLAWKVWWSRHEISKLKFRHIGQNSSVIGLVSDFIFHKWYVDTCQLWQCPRHGHFSKQMWHIHTAARYFNLLHTVMYGSDVLTPPPLHNKFTVTSPTVNLIAINTTRVPPPPPPLSKHRHSEYSFSLLELSAQLCVLSDIISCSRSPGGPCACLAILGQHHYLFLHCIYVKICNFKGL